jgi:hypothetical protein
MFGTELSKTEHSIYEALKSSIEHKGNGLLETKSNVYKETLPEGITDETIKTINKHNMDFVRASHAAVGEVAIDVFRQDKEIQSVHTKFDFMGDNTLSLNVAREKTFNNPSTGEKIDRPGYMSSEVKTKGLKGTSVQRIKDIVAEAAKSL